MTDFEYILGPKSSIKHEEIPISDDEFDDYETNDAKAEAVATDEYK